MSRDQIISDAVSAIQSGQLQVLQDAVGKAVDQSAVEQKASDGTLTQADLDAAVKSATDALNAQVASLQAQDAVDAKAASDAQAALADLQSKFNDLSQKEGLEEQQVAALQAKIDQIKQLLS